MAENLEKNRVQRGGEMIEILKNSKKKFCLKNGQSPIFDLKLDF